MKKYKLLYGKDRRLGLFIHFGLYSVLGYHEQALMRLNMPREEYEPLIHKFNPYVFDAEEWVRFAKECGMSYICITTKHHDGFCLWDTKQTDYNVMNTPFKRDIIKEFSDACQKYDVDFALYYSIPDWHHPNAYSPKSTHQIPPRPTDEPNMKVYIEFVKRQITELLSNYGRICGMSWDIPPNIEDNSLNELVRKLQPGIRIDDRGFGGGDFVTPERGEFGIPQTPYTKLTEAWESVGGQSWGYRYHEDYFTARYLEAFIDGTLCQGGNYLLNVGPTPDGSIPPYAYSLVHTVGKWYNMVKKSYYGEYPTNMLSNHTELYGDQSEFLVTRDKNTLYLHFNKYPVQCGVCLCPITILPEKVVLLNTGTSPDFALDKMPRLFEYPFGQTPFLHIYNLPFEQLGNEVPVLQITFRNEDMPEIEKCFAGEAAKAKYSDLDMQLNP